jgi:DNA-binding CsgD family transcriptional regulator
MSITKKEKLILNLLCKQFYTPKQISQRLKISIHTVRSHIRNLKIKGHLINESLMIADQGSSSKQVLEAMPENAIRLHAQQWHIILLKTSNKYRNILKKSNRIDLDNNTILLYEKTIEIFSKSFFIGATANDALANSLDYWKAFFAKIQYQTGTFFLKEGCTNIKLVQSHYSRINDDLAKSCNKNHDKIKVKGKDGKVWFTIDNSFNLNEAETVHPETAKQDMQEVVSPYMDDLKSYPFMTPSDQARLIYQIASSTLVNTKHIEVILKLMAPLQDSDISPEKNHKLPEYIG